MTKDKEHKPAALPVVSVEDPEIVRLRIAQENIERLMAFKEEHLRGVESTITYLCSEISELDYPLLDSEDREKLQAKRQSELFAYVEKLGIFTLDDERKSRVTEGSEFGAVTGEIRANLGTWKQNQLIELARELQTLLDKK